MIHPRGAILSQHAEVRWCSHRGRACVNRDRCGGPGRVSTIRTVRRERVVELRGCPNAPEAASGLKHRGVGWSASQPEGRARNPRASRAPVQSTVKCHCSLTGERPPRRRPGGRMLQPVLRPHRPHRGQEGRQNRGRCPSRRASPDGGPRSCRGDRLRREPRPRCRRRRP